MTIIPLLDKAYWTTLEILTDEIGFIKDCIAEGLPWFPIDPIQFDWAMRTFRNWHPDEAETYLLRFPWPEPGTVPGIRIRYFVPTEEEKAKIRRIEIVFDAHAWL